MIAMQYSLVLPADYDMDLIDRRVAERGHLTDGFPGLALKAYLHARKQGMPSPSDNLYAPFYLWHTTEGMHEFLCGPGFLGLTQSFGWPSVHTWLVWHAQVAPDAAQARYAMRVTVPIAPHADLAALRRAEASVRKNACRAPACLPPPPGSSRRAGAWSGSNSRATCLTVRPTGGRRSMASAMCRSLEL